jgi:hypothetical protein
MRSIKKIAAISFLGAIFMLGLVVSDASAQTRRVYRVYRPVVVRPYYSGFGWGWNRPFWGMNSWWYDPYEYDPYLREQRDRYYKEKDVKDAQRKIEKNRAKYLKDGVIDAREQEKLQGDYRKYQEKVAKLQKFNREH